jgi:uncharacterized protein with HEPN domain
MSKPNRDLAALWDMIQTIYHIQDFTNGLSYDDYAKNLMVQRAVERKDKEFSHQHRNRLLTISMI